MYNKLLGFIALFPIVAFSATLEWEHSKYNDDGSEIGFEDRITSAKIFWGFCDESQELLEVSLPQTSVIVDTTKPGKYCFSVSSENILGVLSEPIHLIWEKLETTTPEDDKKIIIKLPLVRI